VSDTSISFSPIRVAKMELRNRLVVSLMDNSFGTLDGRPNPRSIDPFVARARGGIESQAAHRTSLGRAVARVWR